jgi:hypothetical protein
MAGATDLLLLLIPIGGLAAYMTNAGGFKSWVDSALVPQGVAAQPSGPGAASWAAADTCVKGGASYMCGCAGAPPFAMGSMYLKTSSTEACRACKSECLKRRSAAVGAYARSYATYPMKGLIVA